jgi:hypothetical protein
MHFFSSVLVAVLEETAKGFMFFENTMDPIHKADNILAGPDPIVKPLKPPGIFFGVKI